MNTLAAEALDTVERRIANAGRTNPDEREPLTAEEANMSAYYVERAIEILVPKLGGVPLVETLWGCWQTLQRRHAEARYAESQEAK